MICSDSYILWICLTSILNNSVFKLIVLLHNFYFTQIVGIDCYYYLYLILPLQLNETDHNWRHLSSSINLLLILNVLALLLLTFILVPINIFLIEKAWIAYTEMKHIGVSAYTDCLHMSFAVFLLTSTLVACNAMSHPKFQLESTMCIQNFKPGSTDKNSDAHRLPPDNDRNKLILDRNCIYWFRFGPEITSDACKVNQNDLPYVSIAFCSLSNYATFSYEAVNIPSTDQRCFVCLCLEKLEANFIHCVSRANVVNKRKNSGNTALLEENSVTYCLELMLSCTITVFWVSH